MQRAEFTSETVRLLKGAPLSCLMLLALTGQTVEAQYLERNSGYSDKIVNSALLLLLDYGMVTRNSRYQWRIAIDVRQLPLMELPDAEGDPSPDTYIPEEIGSVEASESTRKNSESEKFRVPSSSKSLDLKPLENKDLPLLELAESEKFRVRDNLAACDRFGIGEPKKSQLSQLPHVNARMIIYHCESLKRIGKDIHKDLGLAIHWVENNRPVPEEWVDPKERSVIQTQETIGNVCAQTLPESDLKAWESVLEFVQPEFRQVDFDNWIKTAALVSVDQAGWTIRCWNPYSAEWLKSNALTRLQEAAGVRISIEEI